MSVSIPIAKSVCRHIDGTTRRQSCGVAPTPHLLFNEALSYCGPPIEQGERCHICDQSAVCERLHIAWCADCSTALMRRDTCMVIDDRGHTKNAIPEHALEHAFRWYKLVKRLRVRMPRLLHNVVGPTCEKAARCFLTASTRCRGEYREGSERPCCFFGESGGGG